MTSDNKSLFGGLVADFRKDRNWSLGQLGEECGVHRANLWNIEKGRVRCGLAVATRIADSLDLSDDMRHRFFEAAANEFRVTQKRDDSATKVLGALSDLLRHHQVSLNGGLNVRRNLKASTLTLRMRSGKKITLKVSVSES